MGLAPQFGWATEGFERVGGCSGKRVGDDTCSWSFDGHRIMKWNGGKQPFGKVWVAGDVLGLAIDLVGKTVSFSVKGDYREPCGAAFSNIDIPAGWIMPALSSQTGTYRINFGDRPFLHTPPDESYQSVASGMQQYKWYCRSRFSFMYYYDEAIALLQRYYEDKTRSTELRTIRIVTALSHVDGHNSCTLTKIHTYSMCMDSCCFSSYIFRFIKW